MVEEGVIISIETVMWRLDCSRSTIHRYGLNKLINDYSRNHRLVNLEIEEKHLRQEVVEFLKENEVQGNKVKKVSLLKQIRQTRSGLDYKYPGLYEWISKQIEIHWGNIKNHKKFHFIEQAEVVLRVKNTISIKEFSEVMGVSISSLYLNYPEVIEYIKRRK